LPPWLRWWQWQREDKRNEKWEVAAYPKR